MGFDRDEYFKRLLERRAKKRRKGRARPEKAARVKKFRQTYPERARKRKKRVANPPGRNRHNGKYARMILMGAENATGVPQVLLGLPINTPEVALARVVYFYSLHSWAKCTLRELAQVYNMSLHDVTRLHAKGVRAVNSKRPLPHQIVLREQIEEASTAYKIIMKAKFVRRG